ncbi:MAG TPA: nucleoside deaminase [Candidatus Cloacimonetes bacterium]|nr:tRNA adenosine(34) deaminase TadA [Candidatus Cloacimonadota bacterium]HHE40856.1 nucleoside deaminase [Candidatus Cloacimonadota bacterium]
MKAHSDEHWMRIALEEAEKAFQDDEVPVGAIIIMDGKIISRAHNSTESSKDGLAHAEKCAIELAQKKVGKWLSGCTLYATLEPCTMCAGAIVLSRMDRVVFGAFDEKNGACGSLYNILYDTRLNHNPELKSGVMASECGAILKEFFHKKRTNKNGEVSELA